MAGSGVKTMDGVPQDLNASGEYAINDKKLFQIPEITTSME